MLLIESDLPPPASDTELDRAVFACEQAGTTLLVRAADAAESDLLRQARRLAYQALERLGTVKMEDIGVPRSRVPEMLIAIEEICRRHDVRVGTFGHAGDGNLHPNLVFERDDPRAEEVTEAVRTEFYRSGAGPGRNADGRARHRACQARLPGAAARPRVVVAVMRAIKTALDPLNILNPGRVLPPVPALADGPSDAR